MAGLMTGHLLSFIQQRASTESTQNISMSEICAEVGLETSALLAITARREWSVHVNIPARLGDVARNAELQKIAEILSDDTSGLGAPICVLSGLSGIGKSSLAAAWAADHANAYDAVLWVDAANSATLAASFQGIESWCVEAWGLSAAGVDVRTRVLSMLVASSRPWLMVFDNAMEQRQVAPWLPSAGLGHVLITTTDQAAWHGPRVTRLPLGPMEVAEATQLLASRLYGVTPGAHNVHLADLARSLHYWPLALELACAYLNTCLGGVNGISAYYSSIPRSLDDSDSVPIGYPVTLVQAILLSWRRLREGDTSDSPKEVAFRALRFAAHLHPGQIPLHLIVGCAAFTPTEVVDAGIDGPVPVLGPFPLGEIAREMTRYGLAAVDAPFGWDASAPVTPDSLDFTVSMNEIVQAVLRDQVRRDGMSEPVTSFLAFHLQNWLGGLLRRRRPDMAVSLAPHAYEASDLCLENGYTDVSIALLWGNTAAVLAYLEDWPKAENYLRAELDWLRPQTDGDLLFVTTTQMLVQALISRPDWPTDRIEVLDLIAETVPRMDSAMDINEADATSTCEHMISLLRSVETDFPDQTRAADLIKALTGFIPTGSDGKARSLPGRAARVDALISDNRLTEAEVEALDLLQDADPLMASNLLKNLAELRTRQQRWGAVAPVLDAVRMAIQQNTMPTLTMGVIVQNLLLPCLGHLIHPGAEWVLHEVSALAGEFARRGRTFRGQEIFYVEACHAISSALRNDRENAAFLLTADWNIRSDDMKIPNGQIWGAIRGLISRWFGAPNSDDGQPYPSPMPPERPGPGDAGGDIDGLPPGAHHPDGATFYGILTALAARSGADNIEPSVACADAAEALRLLGQDEAYVAACRCEVAILLDAFDATPPVFSSDRHSVVVAPAAGRTGDPSVISLAGSAIARLVKGLPVVVMPGLPAPGENRRYRVARPPAVFDYDRFVPYTPADRRSPAVLRAAFKGLVYAASVASRSSTSPASKTAHGES
ncbi:hypothetical protein [Actinoplanes philippinensis]|uniref:hypothetical protein n=1 Tax=Actinoplanes philippinensis TaxID=35752 RepID=UPI0033CCA643